MDDQRDTAVVRLNSKLSRVTSKNNTVKAAFRPDHFTQKTLRPSVSKDGAVRGVAGDVTFFVLKVVALETARRISKSKCPFAWRSLQACQMLCYPPFKWVQRWEPFKSLVQGMRMLSRPLLVLSIAAAFSEKSDNSRAVDDHNVSPASDDSDKDSSSLHPCDTKNIDESSSSLSLENWLCNLYEELEKQRIKLPERFNETELRRFYAAANGDFTFLLSSVKKTIRWRETFNILSREELKMWSKVVFWHGYDVRHRPCLIVRLGLACSILPNHDRPRFAQAVVSQMEHGILHLADHANPQVIVLVDCEGLSSFRLPLQMLRSWSLLFQDHFPNCLGGLFVIRLPPVVRVMVQTFMKILKPETRQKLQFLGEKYRDVLSEYFQELPACLRGTCICAVCSSDASNNVWCFSSLEVGNDTQLVSNRRGSEHLDFEYLQSESDVHQIFDQLLRTGMIGILMLCVFAAFLAGIWNSGSQPNLFL
ncbi:uncharacterized protein LOC141591440 [Silene latifolia]|uniref:uncharacterized protein LOC141591440 n=1 Tax=Silene latifolia TaxID=37657 RepID=UPI003D7855A5